MMCDECRESGKTEEDYFTKAKWVYLDDKVHRVQLRLLCDTHYNELCHMFGEVEIEGDVLSLDLEDPIFLLQLIEKTNEQFKWYEDMQKILHAEIDKLKKTRNEFEPKKSETD